MWRTTFPCFELSCCATADVLNKQTGNEEPKKEKRKSRTGRVPPSSPPRIPSGAGRDGFTAAVEGLPSFTLLTPSDPHDKPLQTLYWPLVSLVPSTDPKCPLCTHLNISAPWYPLLTLITFQIFCWPLVTLVPSPDPCNSGWLLVSSEL